MSITITSIFLREEERKGGGGTYSFPTRRRQKEGRAASGPWEEEVGIRKGSSRKSDWMMVKERGKMGGNWRVDIRRRVEGAVRKRRLFAAGNEKGNDAAAGTVCSSSSSSSRASVNIIAHCLDS